MEKRKVSQFFFLQLWSTKDSVFMVIDEKQQMARFLFFIFGSRGVNSFATGCSARWEGSFWRTSSVRCVAVWCSAQAWCWMKAVASDCSSPWSRGLRCSPHNPAETSHLFTSLENHFILINQEIAVEKPDSVYRPSDEDIIRQPTMTKQRQCSFVKLWSDWITGNITWCPHERLKGIIFSLKLNNLFSKWLIWHECLNKNLYKCSFTYLIFLMCNQSSCLLLLLV